MYLLPALALVLVMMQRNHPISLHLRLPVFLTCYRVRRREQLRKISLTVFTPSLPLVHLYYVYIHLLILQWKLYVLHSFVIETTHSFIIRFNWIFQKSLRNLKNIYPHTPNIVPCWENTKQRSCTTTVPIIVMLVTMVMSTSISTHMPLKNPASSFPWYDLNAL